MTVSDQAILEEFLEAYGLPPRPRHFVNASHCEECAEANELLMSRTPEDLDPAELAEPSRSWFFSWMGDEGWRYFLPGFVRVALAKPEAYFSLLLERLSPESIANLEPVRREALFTVLDYCRARGYASDDRERRDLRRILEWMASTCPDRS